MYVYVCMYVPYYVSRTCIYLGLRVSVSAQSMKHLLSPVSNLNTVRSIRQYHFFQK